MAEIVEMSDFEIVFFETKVALRKCRESGYKSEPCKRAAELLMKLYQLASNSAEKDTIISLMEDLKSKREAEAEKEKEELAKQGATSVNIDFACPITYPSIPDGAIYNVSVIESKNSYQDNALLIYGPIADELDFAAECYAAKKSMHMRVVDLAMLVGSYRAQATELIASLSHRAAEAKDELIIYKNLNAMKGMRDVEESFCYYLKKMRQDAKGVEQLLLCSDISYSIENVYREIIETTFRDSAQYNMYLQSLDFSFLPLPTMELTLSKLRDKFMLEFGGETEDIISKEGIFLGYRGITEAVTRISSVTGLTEKIAESKERNKPLLDSFIESFGDFCSYDLGDWPYKKKKPAAKKTAINPDDPILNPKYHLERDEYDTVMGNREILAKLERLLNTEGISMPVKCAWAANFSLDGGDMLNIINLPPEQASILLTERWELAYKALVKLMMIPSGKIVFDIPKSNKLLGGQCCDGGNTIRMNESYLEPKSVDDIAKGIDTLLHECFHALQHTAIQARRAQDSAKLGYFLVHFGVHQHIIEWENNFSRYRTTDTGHTYEDYADQVVEAEARIFAADCVAEYSNFNAPRLD